MKPGLGWILGTELEQGSLSTAEAILFLTPCLPFSIPAATTHRPRAERQHPAAHAKTAEPLRWQHQLLFEKGIKTVHLKISTASWPF